MQTGLRRRFNTYRNESSFIGISGIKPDTALTCSADLPFQQMSARPTYQNRVERSHPQRVKSARRVEIRCQLGSSILIRMLLSTTHTRTLVRGRRHSLARIFGTDTQRWGTR